jgi:hypothetical protein
MTPSQQSVFTLTWWGAGLLGTFLRIFQRVDDEEEIGTLHPIFAWPEAILLFSFAISFVLGPISFLFLIPKKK